MRFALIHLILLFGLFQSQAQTWTQKTSIPVVGRYSGISFSIGTKGYIGLGTDINLVEYNDLWEWDQNTNTWAQRANFPGTARESAGYFSYNNELYAGGNFTSTGGNSANYVAKWDGTSWAAVGTGVNAGVSSLGVYNLELYASGSFNIAGGISVNQVAKWDGANWSNVGSGVNAGIRGFTVYNGELYAGGSFTQADGNSVNRIAKWDGANWSSVGSGTDSIVQCMAVYNSDLYVGGFFTQAGGNPASKIAKWNTPTGISNLTLEQKISAYPNPVSSLIHIDIENTLEKPEVKIFDVLGEEKKKIQPVSQKKLAIDVSDLPDGVYFLSLKSKENALIKKIIVQH